ncbi:DUF2505 domain-containing protein [Williamsia sp. M5A3_1d]
MATELDLEHDFDASPEALYALFCDEGFIADRLDVLDATARKVVSHEVRDDTLTFAVSTSMSRSKLPRAVKGFVRGEPEIIRTETWSAAGSGFRGEADVEMKGPGTITGRMTLEPRQAGSTLHVHFDISVPIPMMGQEVEQTLVSEINEIMEREAVFISQRLR